MSGRDRSEQVTALRGAIARIEAGSQPAAGTGFGDGGAAVRTRVALGGTPPSRPVLALDRLLGGGLLPGTLSEVVAARPGDNAAASGFALAVAARFAASRPGPVVWVVEDGARSETGTPYAPGLLAHGMDPERMLVVRTATGAESLWAAEEALRCRAVAAAVLDLWRTRTYDLVASRRLVLAAGAAGVPGLLVAAGAPGSAAALCSAAQARFEIAAAPGRHIAGLRHPLPGRAAWAVRLARIRAGPAGAPAGFDWEKVWPLVWDHEEARFCDAFPVPPSSLSRDRPHPAARNNRGDGWRGA